MSNEVSEPSAIEVRIQNNSEDEDEVINMVLETALKMLMNVETVETVYSAEVMDE